MVDIDDLGEIVGPAARGGLVGGRLRQLGDRVAAASRAATGANRSRP